MHVMVYDTYMAEPADVRRVIDKVKFVCLSCKTAQRRRADEDSIIPIKVRLMSFKSIKTVYIVARNYKHSDLEYLNKIRMIGKARTVNEIYKGLDCIEKIKIALYK